MAPNSKVLMIVAAAAAAAAAADGLADCNVMEYGARGDNMTDDTAAIQRAIDACAGAAHGAVRLPAGRVFLSFPLQMPSHSTLVVETDSVLIASPDIHSWPNSTHGLRCAITPYESKDPVLVPQLATFLWAGNATTDVTITGGGVIDGQGWRWWPLAQIPDPPNLFWHSCRPRLVGGINISRFAMHNITLRNAAMYYIALYQLNGARFTHVTMNTSLGASGIGYSYAPNTDGFNIGGRDIYIGQSSVTNGDDCVPLSPNSSNITVEDLFCTRGNGIVPIIWTDPWDWPGVIENVVFRRIQMVNTLTAIAVKSMQSYIGTVRNILWDDIEIRDCHDAAILINYFGQALTQASGAAATAMAPSLMHLDNITISNVVVTGSNQAGKILCGNGTHRCSGIVVDNVTMKDFGKEWECAGEVAGIAEKCVPQPCF